MIGATAPWLPGVAVGHNDHVAWGMTALDADTADLYVERLNPENPHQIEVAGRWQNTTVVAGVAAGQGPGEAARVRTRIHAARRRDRRGPRAASRVHAAVERDGARCGRGACVACARPGRVRRRNPCGARALENAGGRGVVRREGWRCDRVAGRRLTPCPTGMGRPAAGRGMDGPLGMGRLARLRRSGTRVRSAGGLSRVGESQPLAYGAPSRRVHGRDTGPCSPSKTPRGSSTTFSPGTRSVSSPCWRACDRSGRTSRRFGSACWRGTVR